MKKSEIGFYRKAGEVIKFFPGRVLKNGQLILDIEKKDEYTYPVDGFYYFDSKEEADAFFKNFK
jgi:hypothetical protein